MKKGVLQKVATEVAISFETLSWSQLLRRDCPIRPWLSFEKCSPNTGVMSTDPEYSMVPTCFPMTEIVRYNSIKRDHLHTVKLSQCPSTYIWGPLLQLFKLYIP